METIQHKRPATPWAKYLITFLITGFIFVTAIVANNYFNDKRISQIRSLETGISIDILSLETQFDLLQEQSCKDISGKPVLSNELDSLGHKLAFTEAQLGADNPQVISLKKHYSLLEIKDMLLMKKVSEKCNLKPTTILYFYSNKKGECTDCKRQGYVLTELIKQNPDVRIYSFDYNIGLPAITTLTEMKNIKKDALPGIVLNDKTYSGLQSMDDILAILPDLATTTATSTAKK